MHDTDEMNSLHHCICVMKTHTHIPYIHMSLHICVYEEGGAEDTFTASVSGIRTHTMHTYVFYIYAYTKKEGAKRPVSVLKCIVKAREVGKSRGSI